MKCSSPVLLGGYAVIFTLKFDVTCKIAWLIKTLFVHFVSRGIGSFGSSGVSIGSSVGFALLNFADANAIVVSLKTEIQLNSDFKCRSK